MAPMSSGAPSRYSARNWRSVPRSSTLGPTVWGSQPSANRAVRRSAAGPDQRALTSGMTSEPNRAIWSHSSSTEWDGNRTCT